MIDFPTPPVITPTFEELRAPPAWLEELTQQQLMEPLRYPPPASLSEQIQAWLAGHKTAVYLAAAGLLALALSKRR